MQQYRKRRVSSIPKIPDENTEEVIITVPVNDKMLPPLPVPIPIEASRGGISNNNSDQQSTLSVSSSISTNKSSLGISTPMKSGPVVSTTVTTAERSVDDFKLTKDETDAINQSLYQLQKDNLEQEELLKASKIVDDGNVSNGKASMMGSFVKSFTNYGSSTDKQILDDDNNALEKEKLADGITFGSENGTEMLSYRKSRGKNGHTKNQLSIDTMISNDGRSSGVDQQGIPRSTRSVSSPIANGNAVSAALFSSPTSAKSPTMSMNTPKASEIDYNLYVDEKYLDTLYRYATEKRNIEFHQLFPEVPENDRLLDDFSCALSREILLQGRMYISEHFLCFNSSLLGWVTSIVISLDEIQKFEKRSTAGLFPNGIIVETKEAKHIFASFLSRDSTLNFMETIWSKSITLSKNNHEKEREVEIVQSRTSFDEYKQHRKQLSESDIYTIDDESDDTDGSDDDDDDDDDDDEEEEEEEEEEAEEEGENNDHDTKDPLPETDRGGRLKSNKGKGVKEKQAKLKRSSKKFPGKKHHSPSEHSFDYKANNETIVLEGTYKAPLGLVFELLYGNDIEFHKKLMVLNDGMNFTDYKSLKREGDERTFEYDKKLNYPIGPNSTRVYCTEKLEHCDFNDYVEVLNVSKTPNVPSGTAFDCRTRYTLQWAEDNMTKVIVSFKLAWTGSSWIKGVIENSALSGQKKAAEDLDLELVKILPAKIMECDSDGDNETEPVEDTLNLKKEHQETAKPATVPSPEKKKIDQPEQIKPVKSSVNRHLFGQQVLSTPIGKINVISIFAILFLVVLIQFFMIIHISMQVKELRKSALLQEELVIFIAQIMEKLG